ATAATWRHSPRPTGNARKAASRFTNGIADRLLDLELARGALQVGTQPGQFGTGGGGVLRTGRGLIGHGTDVDDVAVDLLGHGALFFRCAGDLYIHVADG